jgi:hypothetical protein
MAPRPPVPPVVRPLVRQSRIRGAPPQQRRALLLRVVIVGFSFLTAWWWRYQVVVPPGIIRLESSSSALVVSSSTEKRNEERGSSSVPSSNATSIGCQNVSSPHPSKRTSTTCPRLSMMIPLRPRGSQQSPKSQFYPRRFFEQGAGRPWLEQLQATQDDLKLQSRFLWYRPTAIQQEHIVESSILVGKSNSARSTPTNTTTATVCCPALVYYHVHKNGGGSMARHVPLDMDAYNSDRERVMGREEYAKACRQRMQQVYDNLQSSGGGYYNSTGETKRDALQPQQQTVESIFTFLRDPIERFLSSLGQVLQGPVGIMRNSISPCYQSMTTAALIECVLDKMEGHPEQEQTPKDSAGIATVSTLSSSFSSKRTSFLDQHFAPQSYELYSGILGYDIGIAVFDLRDSLSWIVEELGGSANQKPINSAVGSAVWRFPQFQLSTSVLTSSMKRRICTLYQPDVLLLRETGVTSTSCDEHNN